MEASRGQKPKERNPGRGSHRLAQSVFPLQVPEHILGAVGPVLLLQVPQEYPGGYRERRSRGGGSLSRHPHPQPLSSWSPQSPRLDYLRPQLLPGLYSWLFPPPNSESRTLQLLGATAPSGDGRGTGGKGNLRENEKTLPEHRS